MDHNERAVIAFKKLLETADTLLGPGGCPWDHKQTVKSLREYLLSESYELLEAIDLEDDLHLMEELGDVFYVLIFLAKIGEKEQRFSMTESLEGVCAKLIGRHPHVFSDLKLNSIEEVRENWEKIKKKEKEHRTSPLDGIPKHLPALARAKEVIDKTKQAGDSDFASEEELGEALWEMVRGAVGSDLNPELALRHFIQKQEMLFHSKKST